ncbi:MAG: DUF1385 domain-containing protein [Firmicutes bacterium]|nr:DUF1385 domain-containing protein [Bacillota bacterium]
MADKHNKDEQKSCRLGTVGGQAVLEGVMMKSKRDWAVAVRMPAGNIRVTDGKCTTVRDRFKILRLPIVRGVVNFAESMAFSYKTLGISADALGIDETEPETKFEKWLDRHLGKHLMGIIMAISGVLGVVLGFGLFFFLPILITKGIETLAGGSIGWFKNLIEGVIKIVIFIAYLALISLMKDIRRTFEYHGAEHKSIFCYESGEELTVENVKKQSRFHPRCGTSFLFVMLALSILIYSLPFITWDNVFLRLITKLLMLPLIVGVGFEFIRFAGRHNNIIVRILSAPGLWMQRITTREPSDDEIECAIAALKCALPDEFPEALASYSEPAVSVASDEAAPEDDNSSAGAKTDSL